MELRGPAMKKHICGLLALLAVVIWPVKSQALPDENGDYTKLGVGNLECGLWTQARQSGDVYAVWWKTLILGWVQGFLSGYNLYGPATFDITKGSDAEDLTKSVDNYCVEHPLNNIAGAADALVADLQHPHKDRRPTSSGAPR
jgi:hypothetical protein